MSMAPMQLAPEKKSSIPRSAAASRSAGSFWSGRHLGPQYTSAESFPAPA
jgi:hypothetical protein